MTNTNSLAILLQSVREEGGPLARAAPLGPSITPTSERGGYQWKKREWNYLSLATRSIRR